MNRPAEANSRQLEQNVKIARRRVVRWGILSALSCVIGIALIVAGSVTGMLYLVYIGIALIALLTVSFALLAMINQRYLNAVKRRTMSSNATHTMQGTNIRSETHGQIVTSFDANNVRLPSHLQQQAAQTTYSNQLSYSSGTVPNSSQYSTQYSSPMPPPSYVSVFPHKT